MNIGSAIMTWVPPTTQTAKGRGGIMRMEEFIINVYCLQWHASFAMKTDILCFSLIICWADNFRFVGGGAKP